MCVQEKIELGAQKKCWVLIVNIIGEGRDPYNH